MHKSLSKEHYQLEEDLIVEYTGEIKNWSCIPTKLNPICYVEAEKGAFVVKKNIRGWGHYEYKAMQTFYNEGYPVPKPLTFIKQNYEGTGYGGLPTIVGLLIYEYVEGRSLQKSLSEKLIKQATDQLKKMHEDPRHDRKHSFISNYKQTEINRLKMYLDKLSDHYGDLTLTIDELIKEYWSLNLEYKLIHGDYRPQNLILHKEDEKLYMIDFEGTSNGAEPMKDLGVFYAELLVLNEKYAKIALEWYFDNNFPLNTSLKFHTLRRLLVLASHYKDDRLHIKEKILKLLVE